MARKRQGARASSLRAVIRRHRMSHLSVLQSTQILAGWGALMHLAYSRQASKEKRLAGEALAEGKPVPDNDRSKALLPENRTYPQDHPLAAWCFENGAVWVASLMKLKALRRVPGGAKGARGLWNTVLWTCAGGLAAERFMLVFQHILVHKVYSHIAFFKDMGKTSGAIKDADENEQANRGANSTIKSLVWEWLHTTVTLNVGLTFLLVRGKARAAGRTSTAHLHNGDGLTVAAAVTAAVSARPTLLREGLAILRPKALLGFCAKLAVVRSIVDVFFWIGHYAIHKRATYALIHKRHHEHNHPSVWTNQHFSVPDLFIEAILPMMAGIGALAAAGVKVSVLEQALLGSHVIWLEACSHSGKPMPCTSLHAPLAPLYNWLFQWDRRNVEVMVWRSSSAVWTICTPHPTTTQPLATHPLPAHPPHSRSFTIHTTSCCGVITRLRRGSTICWGRQSGTPAAPQRRPQPATPRATCSRVQRGVHCVQREP
jgi:hypothetical protein